MIALDYVKLHLININIDRLLNLPYLHFKPYISKQTGQIHSHVLIAEYHFCEIRIISNEKAKFSGSIHKMWNSTNGIKAPNHDKTRIKGFNGNIFTLKAMYETIAHLQKLFQCSTEQMEIHNIEFGINLPVNFRINSYLTGLLFHANTAFILSYKGTFASVKHSYYTIKIYNKSPMFKLSNPVLRLELKIKRMQELKDRNIEIVTMSDINESNLSLVLKLLTQRLTEIMYYDYTIRERELSKKDLERITYYKMKTYWLNELKSNHRYRQKEHLIRLLNNHSQNLHFQIIKSLLEMTNIHSQSLHTCKTSK